MVRTDRILYRFALNKDFGRRMQSHASQSLNQCFHTLREKWHATPQEDLDALSDSIQRRVSEVICKKGKHMRY